MKGKILIVRCENFEEIKFNMETLSRALKQSFIAHRINTRKHELTIRDTKFRFVSMNQNLKGIRGTDMIGVKYFQNMLPKIIKSILEEK